MSNKEDYPFYEGAVVKAKKVVTESGDPSVADRRWTSDNPGPDGRIHPGFVHAEIGQYGRVEHVDETIGNVPTVRFFLTGTATIVGKDEVEFID